MKISYNWLNTRFFKGDLPSPQYIAARLTMYAFEIESIDTVDCGGGVHDTVFDVKVLPNRAHDCLSHHGIAREIGLLCGVPISYKAERATATPGLSTAEHLTLAIEPGTPCARAAKRFVTDVHVTESPEWLKRYLQAVGQKPINNVVDAANFVMLETGQPVHTFDADKIDRALSVRRARAGETVACLDGKTYTLDDTMMVIADETQALDIAGIKGGAASGIDAKTTHVLVSACNFDAVTIRTTSKKLGLRTDASQRFENGITPELVPAAVDLLVALIQHTDGGAVQVAEDTLDVYPRPEQPYVVGVSRSEIERVLGVSLTEKEIGDIFTRLNFPWNHVDPHADILSRASSVVDAPYRRGASVHFDAPREFDCSSLTAYLFAQAGYAIPRVSVDQYVFGAPVDLAKIEPCDLVFFNTKEGQHVHTETFEWKKGTPVPEGVDHVALFVGNDTIIHARGTRGAVVSESFSACDIRNRVVGARRMLPTSQAHEKRFVVSVPAERLDIRLSVDVIEEVERLLGYDTLPSLPLSAGPAVAIHKTPSAADRIRQALVARGFSEVYTYAFVASGAGHTELANPPASDKASLRDSLTHAFRGALERNAVNADLLGVARIQIFEMGTVFDHNGGEHMSLAIGVRPVRKEKESVLEAYMQETIAAVSAALGVGVDDLSSALVREAGNWIVEINLTDLFEKIPVPTSYNFAAGTNAAAAPTVYKKISPYPFIVRDVAVFVPTHVTAPELVEKILAHAGDLVVKHYMFDTFEKTLPDGTKKVSYGVRLVFQSHERTLTDEEVNGYMEKVTVVLNATPEWVVR